MDIDTLKAFVAVADSGSFSDSAEKLFISQPAVSKRITALESSLDQRLFDRLGGGVELTEAGRMLYPSAIKILSDVEDTRRGLRELSGEVSGQLRVATSHHVGNHRLPSILREFVARYPKVSLDFKFLGSERAYDELLAGDCDLAVITLLPEFEAPIETDLLWIDPLEFVIAKHHPLAAELQPSLAQLSEYKAVMPDLNTFTGRIAKQYFDKEDLTLKCSMTTNYLDTLKMMVSVGLGWSVLPRRLVDDQIQRIQFDGIQMQRELGVVWHGKRSLSNAARAFHEMLVTQATTA